MNGFAKAFDHIIEIEGTSYTDHPSDKGGPTRYGLSTRFLEDFFGRKVPPNEVKGLTLADAEFIYRTAFWDSLRLSEMPTKLALCIFDQAVNGGKSSAVKTLQKVLEITEDGLLGPITLGLSISGNERSIIWQFIKERSTFYCRIVQRDPSQTIWINGWLRRLNLLVEKTLL